MSELPTSLYTKAKENQVSTRGITAEIPKSEQRVEQNQVKVLGKNQTVLLIRNHLFTAKEQLIKSGRKEMVQSMTEIYGSSGIIDSKKLYSWTADYTETAFARALAKNLETSDARVFHPKAGAVGMGSKKLRQFIDASTGKPLLEQRWVYYADAFIPKLLSSVEVKTTTAVETSRKAGKSPSVYANASFGDPYLSKSEGLVGLVHFVQVGRLELSLKQIDFIARRVKFSRKEGQLTIENMDTFFEKLGRNVYADYKIEYAKIDVLSVAKINAAIKNTLQNLGLVAGTPTSTTMTVVPDTAGRGAFDAMRWTIVNYLLGFAEEGLKSTTDQKEREVYIGVKRIATPPVVNTFLRKNMSLMRQGNYAEFINKLFDENNIDFRFRALDNTFGIGHFLVTEDFLRETRA